MFAWAVNLVLRKLDAAFNNNLPSEDFKSFPTTYLYTFGLFAELAVLGSFFYFFYTAVLSSLQQKFVSLQENSGVCNLVPRSVYGQFSGDVSGHWQGHPEYSYSGSIYTFLAVGASLSTAEFAQVMDLLHVQVEAQDDIAENEDLSMNLVTWLSWSMSCDISHPYCASFVQSSIALSGDSRYAFNLPNLYAVFSNVYHDCSIVPVATYDVGSAEQKMVYSYKQFMSTPTCNSTDPIRLGYSPFLNGDSFTLVVDVQRFGDSVGVNTGSLSLAGLERVYFEEVLHFEHNGYDYSLTRYTDKWYAGIDPVYCLQNEYMSDNNFYYEAYQLPTDSINELCFFRFGEIIALPVFSHYGASGNETVAIPKSCAW